MKIKKYLCNNAKKYLYNDIYVNETELLFQNKSFITISIKYYFIIYCVYLLIYTYDFGVLLTT